ncbi:hypothetical protein J3Q00_07490 [Pseudomonas sp. D2-3]
MSTTILPCRCGYEGALAGINHQGVYHSLTCPGCNHSVKAFTLEGLIEAWNKSSESEQMGES